MSRSSIRTPETAGLRIFFHKVLTFTVCMNQIIAQNWKEHVTIHKRKCDSWKQSWHLRQAAERVMMFCSSALTPYIPQSTFSKHRSAADRRRDRIQTASLLLLTFDTTDHHDLWTEMESAVTFLQQIRDASKLMRLRVRFSLILHSKQGCVTTVIFDLFLTSITMLITIPLIPDDHVLMQSLHHLFALHLY